MRPPHRRPDDSRRAGRLLAKLGLSLVVLLVLLLGVEGAVRTRQYLRYGTFGQVLEFRTDPETGLFRWEPGQATETIWINSDGFRSPELEPPSDEVVRLAFLGASTTYCAEVSGNEATWPALVTAALNERFAPRRFDHINAGVSGYTLKETLAALLEYVAPHEPDVIVIYQATNDLTVNSRRQAVEQGVYRGHSDRETWLGKHSLAWYLVEKNLLLRSRTAAARSGAGRIEVDLERLQEPFRRDLSRLVDAARSRADRVCLVTFSHRARAEQSPDEQLAACVTSLYYMPYMTPAGLLASFAAYNDVIREVAASSGSLLIEAAPAVPGDGAHFNDSVHLTDAGARALAEVVVEGLASDPGFLALLDD